MVKEYIVYDLKYGAMEMVSKVDYLEVVEEKERLHKAIDSKDTTNNLRKELKEKDEIIKMNNNTISYKQKTINSLHEVIVKLETDLEEKDGKIGRLEGVCVESARLITELQLKINGLQPQYEDWCELKYWYNDVKTGETKMYRDNMLYEDACELIGMDSDNWNEFKVVKYKKEVK